MIGFTSRRLSSLLVLFLALSALVPAQWLLDSPRFQRLGYQPTLLAVSRFSPTGQPALMVAPFPGTGIGTYLGSPQGLIGGPVGTGVPFSGNRLIPARLNSDNRPDAVIELILSGPRYALSQPDGSYIVGTPPFVLSVAPMDVTIGDYNGDGNDDAVVLLQSDGLYIYEGDGNGHLTPVNVILGFDDSRKVRLEDMDNDGLDDIVTVSSGDDLTSIWRSLGSGKFGQPRSMSLGNDPADMDIYDVTGDGRLDVVTVLRTPKILAVQWNSGNMILTPPAYYAMPIEGTNVWVGDYDGDSIADAVVEKRYLYKGTGGGVFASSSTLPLAVTDLAEFDANGDGRNDRVEIVGQGLRLTRNKFNDSAAGDARFKSLNVQGNIDLLAADFSRDGESDLFVVEAGRVAYFRRLAQPGEFASATVAGASIRQIAVGEFSGSNGLDLVMAQEEDGAGLRYVEITNSNQSYVNPQSVAVPAMSSLVVADFNGDQLPDLATGTSTSPATISIALNAGNRQLPTTVNDTATVPTLVGRLFAADWDGDDDIDLIGRPKTPTNHVHYVMLNNGAGVFDDPVTVGAGSLPAVGSAVGDIDGNGRADLVVTQENALPVVYWDGQAAPVSLPDYTTDGAVVFGFAAGLADINGDGLLDVIAGESDRSIMIWAAQPNRTFRTPESYFVGSYAWHIASGDFDGDDGADLAVATLASKVDLLYNARRADPVPASMILR